MGPGSLQSKGSGVHNIGLRTKFLLSLIVVSTGLTAATLVVVRGVVRMRFRDSIRTDLANSVDTYRIFEKQRDEAFTRSAQLLANLPTLRAVMTTGDRATIQDASVDVFQQSNADVMVLAGPSGNVLGFRHYADGDGLGLDSVQDELHHALERRQSHDWWYADGHLHEMWIQKIYLGDAGSTAAIGFLVLGDRVDDQAAKNFAAVSASEAAFFYDGKAVASTLRGQDGANLLRATHPGAARNAPDQIRLGDENYIEASLNLSDDPAVSLRIFKSLDKSTAFVSRLNRLLLALGAISTLVGALFVFLISDTFTRPLSNLVSGVHALEAGDYSYPLSAKTGDEVGQVTVAFDRMRTSLQNTQAEQRELEGKLRQAHKMEAVGRLAGGVAHDFNNLLTIIGGNSDLLLDRPGLDDFHRRCIEQIQKAARRAVSMTRQLLAFSRMQVLQPQVLDLNLIVAEMGKMLPRLIGEHIEYAFLADPKLATVKADPGQIEQVLMNLAVNARDAMPHGGKLTVRTENVSFDETEAAKRPPMTVGEYVRLAVSDTGHGMDEKAKAHIFEPFFTTKEVGKGTGLGLATVYGVVKQSGGFIWVESAPGQGATFEIYLPFAGGTVLRTEAEDPKLSVVPAGHEKILVVEDEPGVRELACRFLRVKGYSVLEAKDGVEALEVAEKHGNEIEAVLTDMVMPRMGGADLIRNLKAMRPAIIVIFMTGYSEYLKGDLCDVFPGSLILQKPFSPASLVGMVREAFAAKSGVKKNQPEEARAN
jgi:signal transduction histidine kinase/CheY-like chemotaxis protein